MATALEAIREFGEKRAALNREIAENGKKLFKEASDEIFAAHPTLVSFAWTQYAPYFNDGEPCEFSANTSYIYLKTSEVIESVDGSVEDEEDDEDEDDETDFSKYAYTEGPYNNKTVMANLNTRQLAGKAVLEFLENFGDDDLKIMFGDDGKVIVSRKGVEVEEYSHD